jgi:hypothetical protein
MEMEAITTFLTITIPAGLVLFAMYLGVKSFLDKETRLKMLELQAVGQEQAIPLKLQAFERLCLLLERISPANLVIRVNEPQYTATELHQRLLIEIRDEFNHNLSQQLYVSDEAWALIKTAIQNLNSIVNESSASVSPDARGIEMAKAIFERMEALGADPAMLALGFLKEEARKQFGS